MIFTCLLVTKGETMSTYIHASVTPEIVTHLTIHKKSSYTNYQSLDQETIMPHPIDNYKGRTLSFINLHI